MTHRKMFAKILMASSVLWLVNASAIPDPRIIGGTIVTDRSQFAYQALLLYKGVPYCGGTIIDNKHVVTAGHCCHIEEDRYVKSYELSIAVGSLRLTDQSNVKKVTNIIIHENFNLNALENDIALLRISGVFENNTNKIRPINLTKDSVSSGICNISGWGTVKSGNSMMSSVLQYVEVPIINEETCNQDYATYGYIGKNKICAGAKGKDSCQGDSGGPLVCNGELSGIVSYGVECGLEAFPGVYTDVSKYLDWIEDAKTRSSALNIKTTLVLMLIVVMAVIVDVC